MNPTNQYLDVVLFAALPYVALVVFFVKGFERYRENAFTYSSLSTQLLENQHHFWALVPFHYGMLTVLTGHLVAFCIPSSVLWWNRVPARLYILEVTALVFGLLTLLGLLGIVTRRQTNAKVRRVTTRADWLVYTLLLVQVITGVAVAIWRPWGSSWFAAAATPYLRLILWLNPQVGFATAMPLLVKIHLVNMWLLLLIFPYTRLAHILVIPLQYLWRRMQIGRASCRARV